MRYTHRIGNKTVTIRNGTYTDQGEEYRVWVDDKYAGAEVLPDEQAEHYYSQDFLAYTKRLAKRYAPVF